MNNLDEEYDDLGKYIGDTEHDMFVDYDYHINTYELPDCFGNTNLEDFINQSDNDNYNDNYD